MRRNRIPTKKQVEVWTYAREKEKLLYLILLRVPGLGGFWQPITGGIERGESPEEAALRELSEETGIDKPKKFFNLQSPYCFIWKNKRYIENVFAVEAPSTDISLSPEHSAYVWAEVDNAASMLRWDSNRMMLYQLNDILSMVEKNHCLNQYRYKTSVQ
ncbi:NUDIX pyrophosphatase [Methanocella sp. CWC-04]|uniref:NUDIX pyrophosphatase n=1 Tax=Methanooceanicella nereidis TaxID=2052831 RepID=A0AAP2REF8_9EURY|nr:NUDIX pyrophosphatase [Methanocella sp. CWC-04]MCD1295809.1 NUDIX pyrophosphatase [Methanocella sp. CWC-04]